MTRPEPRAEPLRGLTGAGASKVGVEKAMRARDVSREAGPGRPGEPGSGGPQSEGGSGSAGSSPDDS